MSSLAEILQTNPPRLVVMYRRAPNGTDEFQWGIVGAVPILTAIGAVVRAVDKLARGAWVDRCDDSGLVIVWGAGTSAMRERLLPESDDGDGAAFVGPDIPLDPLLGMLEVVKGVLVTSRMAQMAAAQQTGLVDATGAPVKRRGNGIT